MWTVKFWKDAAERALKTFCQTAAALLTGDGLGLLNINIVNTLSVAGLAALVSLLTSVGSSQFSPSGSASLVE